MKNLAVIPARSGSKSIINKNIRDLAGKPMLAYTIEAALKSGIFDEVMVSTDSPQYAEISKKYGANVPWMRSAKNSCDTASSWEMLTEVIDLYENQGIFFDNVALLQPTSPLRDEVDIRGSFEILKREDVTAVVSVCETEYSPLLCNILPKTNCMNGFIKERDNKSRQLLETYYRLNGAIYFIKLTKKREEIKCGKIYDKGCYAYIMPQIRSLDVDTEIDFKIVELSLKENARERMQ